MFRASSCPSSGAYQLQQPPLVYRWNVMVAVLLVKPDRPRPTTLLPPRSNGKPEVATAVDKLLMMGTRMSETCWAVFKRQAIKLRDWCIWLVDLFEPMYGICNINYWNMTRRYNSVFGTRLKWTNFIHSDIFDRVLNLAWLCLRPIRLAQQKSLLGIIQRVQLQTEPRRMASVKAVHFRI